MGPSTRLSVNVCTFIACLLIRRVHEMRKLTRNCFVVYLRLLHDVFLNWYVSTGNLRVAYTVIILRLSF